MSKIKKTFKYRIYPTKKQGKILDLHLRLCCELYNAALQERRDAYRVSGKSIGFAAQSAQLPEIKQDRPDVAEIYSQVLQDVLHRIDKTFKAFFGRIKRREKAGFPRFRSVRRYDSLAYPQLGFSVEPGRLKLSKIGSIKIKLHRPIAGEIKTLTIKREAGRWYAVFSVETAPNIFLSCNKEIGIDVGLHSFYADSDGNVTSPPKFFHVAQKKLRRLQRTLSRRKKGSRGRKEAVANLARLHCHIKNQREDFLHKESARLIKENGVIFAEALNVKGLSSGMLAKSVHDAGWSNFFAKLSYKAESAGRIFLQVNPSGTSQQCSGCGSVIKKDLSVRIHVCSSCGLVLDRDANAAINILRLGRSLLASRQCTNVA